MLLVQRQHILALRSKPQLVQMASTLCSLFLGLQIPGLFALEATMPICKTDTPTPDKKMLSSTQRLIAFALLHQAYASQEPSVNPFINLIISFKMWRSVKQSR